MCCRIFRNFARIGIVAVAALCLHSCRTARVPVSESEMRQIVQAADKLGMYIDYDDNHALYIEAASWLGVPYRWGGTSRWGIDCSAFTQTLYRDVYHKRIARTSMQQLKQSCRRRVRKRKLQEGDLVFFGSPGARRTCSHVGIYLKDHKFVHASSSRGVTVSSLQQKYWRQNWISGGRVR